MKRTLFLFSLLSTSQVWAGGYDTPILYTARHMGMGGTAIAWVDESSALFHNPAGLSRTEKLNISLAFSPVMGHIGGSPGGHPAATSIETEFAFSPFFLGGVAYRFNDWMTLGFAIFPSAGAGGEYKYDNMVADKPAVTDMTKLSFIEFSPGMSFDLPYQLKLGLSYRAILVSLDREKGDGDSKTFDMHLSGWNFASFRAGLQWSSKIGLDLGFVYRHAAGADLKADEAVILTDQKNPEMDFNLPPKLGFGARYHRSNYALSVDIERILNSENKEQTIKADEGFELKNPLEWEDSWTARAGFEYAIMDKRVPLRLGYVYDGPVVQKGYPTAFGTPAGAASHTLTLGGGYRAKTWELNLALARRTAASEVKLEDKGDEVCLSCGSPGDYTMELYGAYIDFSYRFK